MPTIQLPKNVSPSVAIAVSLITLVCVGSIDFVSGDVIVTLLYLLPIGIAAWFGGRKPGIALCFLAIGVWIWNYLSYDYKGWKPACWDTAATLGIFLCYSLLLSSLKNAMQDVEKTARDLEVRVTERTAELINANQALRKTEERLRIALKSAPSSMSMTDGNLRPIWVHNPLLPEAEKNNVQEAGLFPLPEETVRLDALRRRVIETGIEAREEMLLHIDGGERHYDMLVSPFRNEAGEVEGVTTLSLDITDQKRTEGLLRSLNTALEWRAGQLRNLTIESAPGRGTLSTIYVPVKSAMTAISETESISSLTLGPLAVAKKKPRKTPSGERRDGALQISQVKPLGGTRHGSTVETHKHAEARTGGTDSKGIPDRVDFVPRGSAGQEGDGTTLRGARR
jgi:PAS domain-containing protein